MWRLSLSFYNNYMPWIGSLQSFFITYKKKKTPRPILRSWRNRDLTSLSALQRGKKGEIYLLSDGARPGRKEHLVLGMRLGFKQLIRAMLLFSFSRGLFFDAIDFLNNTCRPSSYKSLATWLIHTYAR